MSGVFPHILGTRRLLRGDFHMTARLQKYPSGGPYTLRIVGPVAPHIDSLPVHYVDRPTLEDARAYARGLRPEFTVTILKPIEYRRANVTH